MTRNQRQVADLIHKVTRSHVNVEGDKLWVQAVGRDVDDIWVMVRHLAQDVANPVIVDSHVGTNYVEFTVA